MNVHDTATTSLLELQSRVRTATGQDNVLDLDLIHSLKAGGPGSVTGSIDAALALVHRLIPGAMDVVGSMEDGPFCRLIVPMNKHDYIGAREVVELAATRPLAILAALLSALSASPAGAVIHNPPVSVESRGQNEPG